MVILFFSFSLPYLSRSCVLACRPRGPPSYQSFSVVRREAVSHFVLLTLKPWNCLRARVGRLGGKQVGVSCLVQGSVSSAHYFFSSSFPDAPSRNPPTLSSNGATPHESEATSHPPHATRHHAPNATTNGVATTNHTGNPLPCSRASENLSVYLGVELRVEIWTSETGEGREGASRQAHVDLPAVCLGKTGRLGWKPRVPQGLPEEVPRGGSWP